MLYSTLKYKKHNQINHHLAMLAQKNPITVQPAAMKSDDKSTQEQTQTNGGEF